MSFLQFVVHCQTNMQHALKQQFPGEKGQENVYDSVSWWQEEEDGQCAGYLQFHRQGKSYYGQFRV